MAGPLTIAMVAGEASGDNLGGPLIRELRRRVPDLALYGIGGPQMEAAGLVSRFEMERLSVNGFVDPLLRLPELLRMLCSLRAEMVASPPDLFVGVDFNFFNLLLEGMLKRAGITTAHYVSPTVWAWRAGRLRRIQRAVDLMMTLYPFETEIYRENGIPVVFVGHPRADEIAPDFDCAGARRDLDYLPEDRIVAVLPGSRASEVKRSGVSFLKAAAICAREMPQLKFVIPAANASRLQQIRELISQHAPGLPIRLLGGDALRAMAASDLVLVNSGTATLEAMLLRKPMVMSYQLGAVTYAIVSRMVRTRFFALPNILAGRGLIPELLQDDATPEALAGAVLAQMRQGRDEPLLAEFGRIHHELRRDAAARAAEALLELVGRSSGAPVE